MGEQPMSAKKFISGDFTGGTLVGESDSRPETITDAREINAFILSQIPSPEEQAAQWKKIFEDEINTLKGKQH